MNNRGRQIYKPEFRFGLGGVSLGNEFNKHTDKDAEATLDAAWAVGVRYFDVAPWYGFGLSERRFGHFLHNQKREDYLLSSKVGKLFKASKNNKHAEIYPLSNSPNDIVFDYTADGVRRSIEDSLQRLGVDSLDVAFVHDISPDFAFFPDGWQEQYEIARKGAFPALSKMRDEGIIRAWGIGVNTPLPILKVMEDADPDVCLCARQYSLVDHRLLAAGALNGRPELVPGELRPVGVLRLGAVLHAVGAVPDDGHLEPGREVRHRAPDPRLAAVRREHMALRADPRREPLGPARRARGGQPPAPGLPRPERHDQDRRTRRCRRGPSRLHHWRLGQVSPRGGHVRDSLADDEDRRARRLPGRGAGAPPTGAPDGRRRVDGVHATLADETRSRRGCGTSTSSAMRERTPFPRSAARRLPKPAPARHHRHPQRRHRPAARESGSWSAAPRLAGRHRRADLGPDPRAARASRARTAPYARGGWQPTLGAELAGKTLGLVGLGQLGEGWRRWPDVRHARARVEPEPDGGARRRTRRRGRERDDCSATPTSSRCTSCSASARAG